MRALSLKQPFAHVVLHYGKTIENRRWSTSFRGEFLIHAAKGMSRAYYSDAEAFIANVLGFAAFGAEAMAARDEFRRDFKERARFGGIVGRARLVEVIPPHPPEVLYPDSVNPRWHLRKQYGFVLADVTALPFTPMKGRLSFFNVPEDVATSLEELS